MADAVISTIARWNYYIPTLQKTCSIFPGCWNSLTLYHALTHLTFFLSYISSRVYAERVSFFKHDQLQPTDYLYDIFTEVNAIIVNWRVVLRFMTIEIVSF